MQLSLDPFLPPSHTAFRRVVGGPRRLAVELLALALALALAITLLPARGRLSPDRAPPQVAARRPHIAAVRPHAAQPTAGGVSASDASLGDRAIDRTLAYTSYIAVGMPRRPEIALTFDDGPGPWTPAVLSILERTGTPATFFVIGREAWAAPALVREEARLGLPLGDHTEDHAFMGHLAPAAQQHELSAAAQAIEAAGAPAPRLFRPPYGSFDADTLGVLRSDRMLMVLWTVDTKDFSRPGLGRIIYTALSGARPGAILLMHDGGGDRSETVAALPRIIEALRRRGYRLVTVPQLIHDDPPTPGQAPPRSLAGG